MHITLIGAGPSRLINFRTATQLAAKSLSKTPTHHRSDRSLSNWRTRLENRSRSEPYHEYSSVTDHLIH
jgi:hypothetical protein